MASFSSDALGDALSVVGRETAEWWKNSMKGKKINGTNKVISHIGNNYLGVGEAATRVLGEGQGFGRALTETFAKNSDTLYDAAGERIKDAAADWNYGKIAGSFVGAAAAGRVVSGGGLLRDKNGNANLIGVPFV